MEETTPDGLSRALETIGDQYRLAVIRIVEATDDETIPFDELVDRVADIVPRAEQASMAHRDYVAIKLQHIHLPRLDDCELITYDPETKTIGMADNNQTSELLEIVDALKHISE